MKALKKCMLFFKEAHLGPTNDSMNYFDETLNI